MATCETHSTPQGLEGQLDKDIEVEWLLANIFTREDLSLEVGPSKPVHTPRPPTNIAKEIQHVCKMLEFVTIGVAKVTPQEDGLALQDSDLGQEEGPAL